MAGVDRRIGIPQEFSDVVSSVAEHRSDFDRRTEASVEADHLLKTANEDLKARLLADFESGRDEIFLTPFTLYACMVAAGRSTDEAEAQALAFAAGVDSTQGADATEMVLLRSNVRPRPERTAVPILIGRVGVGDVVRDDLPRLTLGINNFPSGGLSTVRIRRPSSKESGESLYGMPEGSTVWRSGSEIGNFNDLDRQSIRSFLVAPSVNGLVLDRSLHRSLLMIGSGVISEHISHIAATYPDPYGLVSVRQCLEAIGIATGLRGEIGDEQRLFMELSLKRYFIRLANGDIGVNDKRIANWRLEAGLGKDFDIYECMAIELEEIAGRKGGEALKPFLPLLPMDVLGDNPTYSHAHIVFESVVMYAKREISRLIEIMKPLEGYVNPDSLDKLAQRKWFRQTLVHAMISEAEVVASQYSGSRRRKKVENIRETLRKIREAESALTE